MRKVRQFSNSALRISTTTSMADTPIIYFSLHGNSYSSLEDTLRNRRRLARQLREFASRLAPDTGEKL